MSGHRKLLEGAGREVFGQACHMALGEAIRTHGEVRLGDVIEALKKAGWESDQFLRQRDRVARALKRMEQGSPNIRRMDAGRRHSIPLYGWVTDTELEVERRESAQRDEEAKKVEAWLVRLGMSPDDADGEGYGSWVNVPKAIVLKLMEQEG